MVSPLPGPIFTRPQNLPMKLRQMFPHLQHRLCLLAGLVTMSALVAVRGETAPMSATSRQSRPPNVLFIASDDLTCALGTYGNPIVKSPNIDRLAARGVRFDRAYSQFPLCNPSRASIMTGRRPDEIGVYNLTTHFRAAMPDVVTLSQYFMNHGYFSARAGKIYHYGVPTQIGTPGLDDPPSWNRTVNPKGRDKLEEKQVSNLTPKYGLGIALSYLAAEGTDHEQTDGKVADAAIEMMRDHRDEPFFVAAGFYRPHTPYIAPKRYFDLYPLESIPAPPNPTESLRGVPPVALWRPQMFWGLNSIQQREIIRAYYASVSFMDAQVGRLLDALDELGLTDNTIVIFWSDHGYLLGEHGQWQKQSLFEESARVPLIIAGPGVVKGQPSERVVELLDVYPTLVELAGLSGRPAVSGRSLLPLLREPARSWPYAAFSQVDRGSSIRTEVWRYSEWGRNGEKGTELYDHRVDPLEQHNLAQDPNRADLIAELSRELRATVAGHRADSQR